MAANEFILFSGTANLELARAIARALSVELGAASVRRLPGGEVSVDVAQPVRRKDVFIVQPTGPPTDAPLMELLALVDACRRAAAARVTAVVPYFGYARSDKRQAGRREPILASAVARMLEAVGVAQVTVMDPHSPQLEGFFRIPVDSLTGVSALCEAVRPVLPEGAVVVSPDAGRAKLAAEYARCLGTPVVVLNKQRESATRTRITHITGDVAGRVCVVIDDMITTGNTCVEAIGALLRAGARRGVYVAATHGLLVGGAPELLGHEALAGVFVTDTVAGPDGRPPSWPGVRVVSVGPLFAEAIRRDVADGAIDGRT